MDFTKRRGFSYVALALLAAVLATGYIVHRDYGVPWDEPIQHSYGQAVALYVFRGDTSLLDNHLRVYGPAYEVALLAAEFLAGVRDSADILALRHLINFLTFVLGVVFLYRLGLIVFRSRPASLAVAAALVLSPVMFGHAFFNSKDLPFLAFFIVAMHSLMRFLDRPRLAMVLAHALASAWLIAIRVPGILIPAITVIAAIYCAIRAPAGPHRTRPIVWMVPYLVLTAGLTYILWPSLWPAPWTNFWHALQTMSRYPWEGDVIYAGQRIPATSLPWHYAPVWIAITTPLIYLAGFLVGLPAVVARAWREVRGQSSPDGLRASILLAWFFAPLLSVIAFRSVIYDGWRQLFFVYPALLLIGMEGYLVLGRAIRERGRDSRVIRWAGIGGCVLAAGNAAAVAAFMIRAHPHEHVYFNALAGGPSGARFRFDMDYWGLSYRRGLQAILRADQDPVIPIYARDGPADYNARALPYRERRRFVFVDSIDQAKYFVGAYRLQQEEYPYPDVVDRVEVDGAPILLVAALDRSISLTRDTAPSVAPVRAGNEAYMAGLDVETVHSRIEAGMRTWLARFVRRPRLLEVEVAGDRPADLRQGRIARLRLRILDAEIGDFARDRPGIPLRAFDVTVEDLIIDVARPMASIRPALMERLTIGEFTIDEQAVNAALPLLGGTARHLRVHFQDGAIRAEYLDRPGAEITMRFRIGPDPWKSRGDNLWFNVERLRVAGWRVPLAWLLQAALGRYSPAIDPEKVDAAVELGGIEIRDGVFRLGTSVHSPAR